MGCKFSIQVDQPRPKTPVWHTEKKAPRERKESTGSTQTEEDKEEDKKEDKEEDKGYDSSPEQVTIKTISKSRTIKEKWKP